MKIHLPSYPNGIHEIIEDLKPSELDLSPAEFPEPIHVKARLDRHDPYFDLRIKLATTAIADCDRCLSETTISIETENPLLFVMGQPPGGEPVDDDDITYVRQGTVELDLSSDVRDFLILAFTGRHLCSEDCLGLCVNCGANLNDGPCNCPTN
ncbi:MAG: DUF177 domain-containing protein [bacterium]|nr:DUF177 domain-containing protein [bacterium]